MGLARAQERLHPINGCVNPAPLAAGVAVADKAPLEYWLDDAHQGMVDDAIRKRRGLDDARLGIADLELARQAGLPDLVDQGALQLEQALLDREGKIEGAFAVALTAAALQISGDEVVECRYLPPTGLFPA